MLHRSLSKALTAGAVTAALLVGFTPASRADTAPPATPLNTVALQKALDDNAAISTVVGTVGAAHTPGGDFNGVAGKRTLSPDIAATTQDRGRISSITKPMTATMVMQEIEAGNWTLHTTIDDIAPGLYPGHGNVTIEQLLNHTSGMPDAIWHLLEYRNFFAITPDLLLPTITRHYSNYMLVFYSRQMKWNFEPGTDYSYSNTGYVVLSMLLERQNGTAIENLIKERIFRPATMKSAVMGQGPITARPTMTDYAVWKDGSKQPLERLDLSIFSGAGAVYCTAEDITRFFAALMQGKLLGQQYVDMMSTPRGAAAKSGYGFGLFLVPDPCPTTAAQHPDLIGHDGAGFGSVAIGLASRDGSRTASQIITGRPYNPNGPWASFDPLLSAAFSCPTPGTSLESTSMHVESFELQADKQNYFGSNQSLMIGATQPGRR